MTEHTEQPVEETSNGNGLPPARKAIYAAGIEQYQTLAAERDLLASKVAQLHLDLAAQKVVNEAMTAQLNDMESRMATMTLVRDQAVADRAVYETLFISFQSQLRAFAVPSSPLVVEKPTNAETGQ